MNYFQKIIFLENINLNNMFQYGFSGVNSFHETIDLSDQKSNFLNGVKINDDVINLLKNSIASNPLDSSLLGRETYKRNFIDLIFDFLFEPLKLSNSIHSLLYKYLNEFARVIFLLLKKISFNKKSKNSKECILLQVHDDSNLINNININMDQLINNLIKKRKTDIYVKPHPQDYLYAFFLKIKFLNRIKFDFSLSLSEIHEKKYKCFHTLNSSYGAFIASNTKVPVLFYGISPLLGSNSLRFTKIFLKSSKNINILIKQFLNL